MGCGASAAAENPADEASGIPLVPPPLKHDTVALLDGGAKIDEGTQTEKASDENRNERASTGIDGANWVTSRGTRVQAVHYNVHSWFFEDTDSSAQETPETHSSFTTEGIKEEKLVILHFNDVYEIGAGKVEPIGGASRFAAMLNRHADANPLVLFSGDAINPSILSQVTHGQHMIECLNLMNIGAACIGNHDLDLGEPNLEKWIQRSNFPWLCSNCWHKGSGQPLGLATQEAVVISHAGFKIGVMGLIEEDWLSCCTTVGPESLDYVDFVKAGRKLAAKLRADEGCDFIIALTHFREPNDERLAADAPEIDIVLGGHDHHYAVKQVEPTGTWYVKSGADFKWLSRIEMSPGVDGVGRGEVTVEKLEISGEIEEDVTMKAVVDHYLDNLKAAMGRELGRLGCELDARFAQVRTQETNCGNWIADIARTGCNADIGFINSGTLRADVVYPEGPFTVEDMVKLLPFENLLVVVAMKGRQILEILENGVSQWPKKEGRFPQVSNLRFTFDGDQPSGSRLARDSVTIADEPLDLEREYTVAALDIAAAGKEGYDEFLKCRIVRDSEMNADLKTLVRNHMCLLPVTNALLGLRRGSITNSMNQLHKWQNKVREKKGLVAIKPLDSDWMVAKILGDDDVTVVRPVVEGRIVNLAAVPGIARAPARADEGAPRPPTPEKPMDGLPERTSTNGSGGADWMTTRGTKMQAVNYNVHSWFFQDPDSVSPLPPETHCTLSVRGSKADKLVILHFNDVYEIGGGKVEPVGGAARFVTMLNSHADANPLVLFSGDAINPSILSQVTHGQHMIECLNLMNIGAACIGNHDLDLGETNLEKWVERSNFPWLCSNCWHKDNGQPLGLSTQEAVVIVHEGYKIGVIGLIEEDWLSCCTTVGTESLDYVDFVEAGRKLAAKLRADEGCDYIIALTHFREPNDERLAADAPEIDIVLGGHDHHYATMQVQPTGTWYVKSGNDFKWLSRIEISPGEGGEGRGEVTIEKFEITCAVEEDVTTKAVVDYYMENLKAAMGRELGRLGCELDSRFAQVRTQETNCGNWIADIARLGCEADIGFINSGALRADVIFPEGPFTVEDLVKLLPFENLLLVVAMSGEQILEILENGVSQWPKKEGRFPQVSNMSFTFDGRLPSGSRVLRESVVVAGEPLDLEREYHVAALNIAAAGLEGYDTFLRSRIVRDSENNADLKTLVRNHMCLRQVTGVLMGIRRASIRNSMNHLRSWQNKVRERKGLVAMKPLDNEWMVAKALEEENVVFVRAAVTGRITNLAVSQTMTGAQAVT